MLDIDKGKVEKLVKSIIEKHSKRSYRKIAKEDYPAIIKAGTLCRIVKSEGRWIPKNRKILIALDLITIIHKPDFIKKWEHLPKEERHKVIQEYLKWREKKQ